MNRDMDNSQINTAALNQVFENHLDSYLSKEALQKIAEIYGREIAEQAQIIYDEAMNCPVDWRVATVDDGLLIMSQFLNSKYPWLSQEAHYRFTGAFIMAWK